MSAHVSVAEVNILEGLLSAAIPFQPGLNIISGENGTLKTKLLQEIKANRFQPSVGASGMPRIQAISPKRNSARRAVDAIIADMRQHNKTLDKYVSDRGGAALVDTTFQDYPSFGELFFFLYEHQCKDGGLQTDHMISVTKQFNEIITEVFPDYELYSEWDNSVGIPRLLLIKKKVNKIPIEALSTGEEEVLSLITNLYASKEAYDVFLIDEPEAHLNWHLEASLFSYLDQFCDRYEKQIIIATHSRAVFKESLLPKTVFFYWNNEGRVSWGKELTSEQRKRIAGEAIERIRLADFSNLTFFVEDKGQRSFIHELGKVLKAQASVMLCGNAANVRSLFQCSKADGGWKNAYFLEDGDNQGNPYPNEAHFMLTAEKKYPIFFG